jgi:hypothetical protein
MAGITLLSSLGPARLDPAKNLLDVTNPGLALNNIGGASVAYVQSLNVGDIPVLGQNILYLGLLLAALRNAPTGLVDGIADPFNDLSDINVSASSGYTFNPGQGTISATPGGIIAPFTTVSTPGQAISSPSYDTTRTADKPFGSSGINWVSTQGSTSGTPTAWIGQDFGVGNAQSIAQVQMTQGPGDYAVSSVLGQVADSPAGPWTTVLTSAVSGASTTLTIPSPQARRCFRLLANSNVSNSLHCWQVATLQFQTGTVTNPANMVLQSATLPINAPGLTSPSAMRVLVQLDATSAAVTANTDMTASMSRDGGTTFTTGTLVLVQAMPDGSAIYDTGWTSVVAQPGGNGTMTYQVNTLTKKAVVLTGVSLQVRP